MSWIIAYLTGRPQYVRLGVTEDGHNTGDPQGTVLCYLPVHSLHSDLDTTQSPASYRKTSWMGHGDQRESIEYSVGLLLSGTTGASGGETKEMVGDLRRTKANHPCFHPGGGR